MKGHTWKGMLKMKATQRWMRPPKLVLEHRQRVRKLDASHIHPEVDDLSDIDADFEDAEQEVLHATALHSGVADSKDAMETRRKPPGSDLGSDLQKGTRGAKLPAKGKRPREEASRAKEGPLAEDTKVGEGIRQPSAATDKASKTDPPAARTMFARCFTANTNNTSSSRLAKSPALAGRSAKQLQILRVAENRQLQAGSCSSWR